MAPMPNLIFIVGSHRSGTSAFTRCLNLAGVALHQELLPANEYNRTGYWESMDCVRINDELLDRQGLTWSSPGPLPENWTTSDAMHDLRDQARSLLQPLACHDLVALKDPRISRLLPFWLSVAEDAGFTSRVAICLRHPFEVADSLHRRDHFPLEKSLMLWLRHTTEALALSTDVPRAMVRFNDVLSDPQKTVRECAAQLDIPLRPDWDRFSNEVAQFISPELRSSLIFAEMIRRSFSSDSHLARKGSIWPVIRKFLHIA